MMRSGNDPKPPSPKFIEAGIASIDAEINLEPDGRSSLDVQGLFELREADFLGPANDTKGRLSRPDQHGVRHIDPKLDDRLFERCAIVQAVLTGLRETKLRVDVAESAVRRYTAEAIDAGRVTHAAYVHARDRISGRIPATALGKQLRDAASIGGNVPEDGPAHVARAGRSLLNALLEDTYKPLFVIVEMDAVLLANELRPSVLVLEAALKQTPSAERKGEVTPELVFATRRVDVAFQRLTAFLQDGGARAEAAVINGRLPRKLRRASDTKPTPPPAPKDPKDPTEPTEK